MKKSLVLIIFVLTLQNTFAQTLTKKAYLFGVTKDFVADKCDLFLECDCCSAEMVLLTKSTFAIIDRCVNSDTFYAGTYAIKDSTLVLVFNQQVVNETDDEATNKITRKLRPFTLKNQSFRIKQCGDGLILENDGSFYEYGIGMGSQKELELRKELANSSSYKMLTR